MRLFYLGFQAVAMTESSSSKSLQLLFLICMLTNVIAFQINSDIVQSENAKVELYNLSLPQLTDSYLKPFNADLALLKISHCQIEEIHKQAFEHLKHLNLLDLSNNKIKERIHPQTFSNLPSLEILILKNIGLHDVDLNLTNVEELILSQNNIEDVTENSIRGHNVNYLDLSSNKIKALKNSLKSLYKLSMIDLSKNEIEYVGENVFESNRNLLRILASENKIKSTQGLRLPKLKTLDLFSNKITALKSDAFDKMPFLEELVLAFNQINSIEDPFKDLMELKFLNLAWNFISEIKPSLFRNNLFLSHLLLQGNKLKSLNRFDGTFHHLVKLDLSHNELAFIDDEFFRSMPSLSVLDLSFNKLKVVVDMLEPLGSLKILDIAYNNIVLSGYEFSKNYQLSRVNLSSNNLESGLSNFKSNPLISELDLSNNVITDFCDSDVSFEKLRKINVRGNRIHNLKCLRDNKFDSLCVVDLRNNPLACEMETDDMFLGFVKRKSSPFKLTSDSDILHDQCENLPLNQRIALWNSVKRELCPTGQDINVHFAETESLESDGLYDSSEESDAESLEEDSTEQTTVSNLGNTENKRLVFIPIGKIPNKVFSESSDKLQSERVSWEQIDEDTQFIDSLEEQEAAKSHYNWYAVAVALIGISLGLTCFNLVVFLYIRFRVWRKSDLSGSQKYTFLKNEVYKNTTEPANMGKSNASLWFSNENLKNKIFPYEKINEFFVNFGGSKKNVDSESAKNVLIHSTQNLNGQNC